MWYMSLGCGGSRLLERLVGLVRHSFASQFASQG
jgi:hypothetical protein